MKNENVNLLDFIKDNINLISKKLKIDVELINDIESCNEKEVECLVTYFDEDESEYDYGISFRFYKDRDSEFEGEDGEKYKVININEMKLVYISYNI